jgi:hypothetical protein
VNQWSPSNEDGVESESTDMRRLQHDGKLGALMALLCAACSAGDTRVPWDTTEMVLEVTAELRRFERVTSEARDVEVLAWRAIETVNERATPPGLPPVAIRRRSEGALLWGRFEATGPPEWLLIDAFRDDRDVWRRSMIFTYFKAPPPRLRPGQTADRTWHGFNRYAKSPTSRKICEFASVSFLAVGPEIREDHWRCKVFPNRLTDVRGVR